MFPFFAFQTWGLPYGSRLFFSAERFRRGAIEGYQDVMANASACLDEP